MTLCTHTSYSMRDLTVVNGNGNELFIEHIFYIHIYVQIQFNFQGINLQVRSVISIYTGSAGSHYQSIHDLTQYVNE